MRHGELIRRTREARSMTRTQLSRAAGVDRGMLAHIEDGALSGSVETLLKLARAMDMDLNLLKDGSGTASDGGSIATDETDPQLGTVTAASGLTEDDTPTLVDAPSAA